MSKGEQDGDYKPRATTVKAIRTSRRTRKVEHVDYSEAELESDTESEITLSFSSTLVVGSPVKREKQLDLNDDWELGDL